MPNKQVPDKNKKSKPIAIPKKKSSMKKKKKRRKSSRKSLSVSFDESVIVDEPDRVIELPDSPPARLAMREHTCDHCKKAIHCVGLCKCFKRPVIQYKDEVMCPNLLFFCKRKCYLEYKPPRKGWLW